MFTRIAGPKQTLLIVLLVGFPALVQATDFQLVRLAMELNRASTQLAVELRNSRGYGSTQFAAEKLGRAAGELAESLSRQRSQSRVSARLSTLSRQYSDLENSFLRANGGEHSRRLLNQLSLISTLYTSLSREYQVARTGQAVPYYYPPRAGSGRHSGLGSIESWRDRRPGAQSRTESDKPNRFDYGRLTVPRPQQFNQGSAVLERQRRRSEERERLDWLLDRRHGVDRP